MAERIAAQMVESFLYDVQQNMWISQCILIQVMSKDMMEWNYQMLEDADVAELWRHWPSCCPGKWSYTGEGPFQQYQF
ncbi:hypothetical protein HZ326_19762 [Fusarium oxysporum f. sp. albedinis]|nr:hypothetical protein HZ326_19762 [Fusarium oxysporum f. sp. albedinis]